VRKAEDRRVRRTREALQASFASLVVSKGYDALTIQDVLDDADVGRSTFYSHFHGKEDLLRAGIDRLRAEIEEAGAIQPGEPFGFVPALFDHAARHAGLYAALLGGSGGKVARDEACVIIGQLVEAEVDRIGLADDMNREAVTAFISGGLVQSLEVWARTSRRSEAEAFYGAVRSAAAQALGGKGSRSG
jgi:AcrR family transcriptional regulator